MNLCSRIRLAVPSTFPWASAATTVRTPAAFRPRQMRIASSGVRSTGARWARQSRKPRWKSPCSSGRSSKDIWRSPPSWERWAENMVPHAGRPDEASFPAPPVPLDGPPAAGYPGAVDSARRAPMATPFVPPTYAWEVPPTPRPVPVVEPGPDPAAAERLAERDVWRVFPSAKPAGGPHAPLTTDWFKHLETKRYRRHG